MNQQTFTIPQAIQIALQHHQAGRLSEAEAIYGQILAAQPDHADALNLLGVLAHQSGKNETAVELIGKAVRINPNNPYYLNGLGEAYRGMNKLEPAMEHYQKAIKLQPKFVEAHYNLGIALKENGAFNEAAASYRKAIKLKPDFAEAYGNLGNVLVKLDRMDEAVACYRKAIKLNPHVAEAHFNLGQALMALGQVAAIACLQEAIRLDPSNPTYLGAFSEVLLFHPDDAADYVQQFFLLAALKNDAVDPYSLSAVSGKLVCRDPLIQRLLAAASGPGAGAPELEPLLDAETLRRIAVMPLLLALLEEAVVADWRLELLLTGLRRVLLSRVADAGSAIGDGLKRFVCALALQCFSNDYVWSESEAEVQLLRALEKRITSAIGAGHDIPEMGLVMLGAYRPLYLLDLEAAIAAMNGADTPVQAVIQRLWREPKQEETLKKTIPALNAIRDGVSLAVRRQYEENPYPRWKRVGAYRGGNQPPPSGERLEMLVAGCGTGSHSIKVALRNQGANILAVDLSLSSLAYAKRASEAMGIANIEYQQADILEIGALGRQFDLIECAGVLHHMENPMAGWRNLVALLRPGGRMKIALYSGRARREVTLTRQKIGERGYLPTPDHIRRCRREIMAGGTDFGGAFISSTDFFSTSTCRDLLFHVQEHLFSPREVGFCLEQLGLKFTGFDVSAEVKQRYKRRFPDDASGNSLTNWEIFEEENPDTFFGMLQFWVERELRI